MTRAAVVGILRAMPMRPAVVLVSLLVFASVLPARAADAPAAHRFFDPATVETVHGEVVRVSRVAFKKRNGYGIHLLLKTDKERLPVRLGPGWYVEKQKVKIDPKDTVEVTGSRMTFAGKPAIVATDVKKGDHELRLRDEKGDPLWRKKHAD